MWRLFHEANSPTCSMRNIFLCMCKQGRRDLINLIPGDMSANEYEAKFNELPRYSPEMVAEEHDKLEMFENGLRPKIKGESNYLRSTS